MLAANFVLVQNVGSSVYDPSLGPVQRCVEQRQPPELPANFQNAWLGQDQPGMSRHVGVGMLNGAADAEGATCSPGDRLWWFHGRATVA